MPTNAELQARILSLETKVGDEVMKGVKKATLVTQTNLLNQQIKAYDRNVKIVGMSYDIKDSRSLNTDAYEAWSSHVIKTALVDTKVMI